MTKKQVAAQPDNDEIVFTPETAVEYCTNNFDKKNKKHVSWIPEELLSGIRFADLSGPAPIEVPRYIISEYMGLGQPGRNATCDRIARVLHPQDWQAALENIFQQWKADSADTKRKAILLPYCIYATDSTLFRLENTLKEWVKEWRVALTSYAVNAIAMNGGNLALMLVDNMSIKFPHKQVKKAAAGAFSLAAAALGVSEDELSDKIVPTLGFSPVGEKTFDYGPRQFVVTLMPDFSLSIFDPAKNKTVKSMPAPGVKDDPAKAAAAKAEFSELKKQIKVTVKNQTERLGNALMDGRTWSAEAWRELFVENPVMRRFATGLIWGVYDAVGQPPKATFRYMEDGTFNTVDETEYTLPEKASIALVHPVELAPEMLDRWREQLDDYEIVQPVVQLTAPIEMPGKQEIEEGYRIVRYAGIEIPVTRLVTLAKKHNMLRGDVIDGGSYRDFHWVDKFLGVAVQIRLDDDYGLFAGGFNYDDITKLDDVVVYRLDDSQTIDYYPSKEQYIPIDELPKRFVCSVVGILDKLTEK